ncbi:helix-turn-helix domain-containing protein [Waltera acetigignens]
MQKEAFGKLLVILRKKNGLSQKELAERLSVSTSAVSKWENGGSPN